MNQTLLNALKKRYSTKVFQAGANVDLDKIETLLESLCLAPTSINSQPWHLFVITNQELKKKLSQAAWDANKAKFEHASHLLLFCAKTQFGDDEVREIETLAAQVRDTEVNEARIKMMQGYVATMDQASKQEWMKRQVFLVFGQFLMAAALLEIDACPIEGFIPEQMDQLFDLEDKKLTSVVAAALGVSSADDFNRLEVAAKARFNQKQMITIID